MSKLTKEYIVFWTYSANYADNPRRVWASSVAEACVESCFFDPYAKPGRKDNVRFIVFEVGGDLVHNGFLEKELAA